MYISTISNALSAGPRIAFVTMPEFWRDAVWLAISSPRTLEDLKQGLQIIQSLL
jgi:DNA-binding transcriptional MocR family regulator